jgi:hypothetical protein
VTSPALARRAAALVRDHLDHRPEGATHTAAYLDRRLEHGPAVRSVLLPLVTGILRAHPPEVRRALAPVLAAPGTHASRPLRQELLDALLEFESDPDVLTPCCAPPPTAVPAVPPSAPVTWSAASDSSSAAPPRAPPHSTAASSSSRPVLPASPPIARLARIRRTRLGRPGRPRRPPNPLRRLGGRDVPRSRPAAGSGPLTGGPADCSAAQCEAPPTGCENPPRRKHDTKAWQSWSGTLRKHNARSRHSAALAGLGGRSR